MQDLKSRIIFVGSFAGELLELGRRLEASVFTSLVNLKTARFDQPPEVAVISSEVLAQIQDFTQIRPQLNLPATTQIVVVGTFSDTRGLVDLANKGRVFKVLKSEDQTAIELAIQQAIEECTLQEQHRKLIELFNQQNESLIGASRELEERVRKRQQFLENSKTKLLATSRQLELLERALSTVYLADSVGKIEAGLWEVLGPPLELEWLRIVAFGQSQVEYSSSQETGALEFSITVDGLKVGSLLIRKKNGKQLLERDHDLLEQVSASVSLAVEKLKRLEEAETFKFQWEATFDAISAPVALIDENYLVRRANRAFAKAAGVSNESVSGTRCHSLLFGRTQPCDKCHLGTSFILSPNATSSGTTSIYAVSSHKIQGKSAAESGQTIFVNTYRDVGERYRLERQILESAKLAELGVIGGSIAHELNNPLSGIITFLQLLKADLENDPSLLADLAEMEAASQRCKVIIQNLLGFSRKQEIGQPQEFQVSAVLRKAIALLEIQAKSRGIEFRVSGSDSMTKLKGYASPVTQALVNLLKAQLELATMALSEAPTEIPSCQIELSQQGPRNVMEFLVRGFKAGPAPTKSPDHVVGLSKETQLGIKFAAQVFVEHGGVLEVFSKTPGSSTSEMRLARLVF